jgi:hypothetical protein
VTRKIVVIGATSTIAQWCVRLWLQEGPAHVVLGGRDVERLEQVAADLRVRSPGSTASVRVLDFHDAQRIEADAADICRDAAPDLVLIAHGSLPDQQLCQQDAAAAEAALRINAVSPALFAEAFARQLENAGRGTLVILGSVAGDRGRKKNYVYGAAKGLLDRYAQGLQHRFAATAIKVVLVKPGPTDTPMTAQLPARGLASPEEVARRIVTQTKRGVPVIYAPAKWRVIMFIIRHLPRFVFDKLNI